MSPATHTSVIYEIILLKSLKIDSEPAPMSELLLLTIWLGNSYARTI